MCIAYDWFSYKKDEIDFGIKKIPRDRGGHSTMTKGLFHQKDMAILDAYPAN